MTTRPAETPDVTLTEAIAAALHDKTCCDNPGHAEWEGCATTGPCAEDAAALAPVVAARVAAAKAEALAPVLAVADEFEQRAANRATGPQFATPSDGGGGVEPRAAEGAVFSLAADRIRRAALAASGPCCTTTGYGNGLTGWHQPGCTVPRKAPKDKRGGSADSALAAETGDPRPECACPSKPVGVHCGWNGRMTVHLPDCPLAEAGDPR